MIAYNHTYSPIHQYIGTHTHTHTSTQDTGYSEACSLLRQVLIFPSPFLLLSLGVALAISN